MGAEEENPVANSSDNEEDQESIGSRIESEVHKYVESLFKKLNNEEEGGNRLLAEEENPVANSSDNEEDQESIGSRIESEVHKYVESLFKKLNNEDDGGHRLLAEKKDDNKLEQLL